MGTPKRVQTPGPFGQWDMAAICGSDLHLYHGMMPDTRVGMTFGHEFIGVVEEVGPSVRSLKRGDRVMVPFNIYCGSCYFCARGLYSNCHNVNPNATAVGGIYGYSHTCGGYDGGQAEFVRVPFADVGPVIIPDWMDDEDALLCTDALATGYFGAQLADIAEGDTVAVFGAGPVGLYAAKSAWLMGAGRVLVIDYLENRLDKARTFAHAETYNFAEYDDIVVTMKKATGRRELPATRHRREAQIAGRISDRAELGHRLGPQGRDGVGDGRLRTNVQRGQIRRRNEQRFDVADEPVSGETAVAAAVLTHPERLPQAQRHCHAQDPVGAHRGGIPHLLGETRRLHQAHRPSSGQLTGARDAIHG